MSIIRDNRTPEPAAGYSEADAILIMRGFVETRARAVDAKKGQDAIGDQLRSYLEQNGGRLYDGETGWEGRLAEREGPATYDVLSMEDRTILAAAHAGALNVDAKVIAALKGKAAWVDDLARFKMPGKPSQILTVTKRESAL